MIYIKRVLITCLLILIISPVPAGAISFDEQFYSGNDILFYDPRASECTAVSSTLSGSGNIEKTWNYFISKGLDEKQVAGIIGNLDYESPGINPTTNQSGGPAKGVAQWEPPRWNNLVAWAGSKDIYNLQTQLDFIWHELSGSEKSSLTALKTTTTIRSATDTFLTKYERASVRALDKRIALANLAYGKYATAISGSAPVSDVIDPSAATDAEPTEEFDTTETTTPSAGVNPSCSDLNNPTGSVVAIAKAELAKGVKENPIGCDGNGRGQSANVPGTCGAEIDKYTDKMREFWCADFVSWVYKQAGTPFTGGASGGWRHAGVSGLRAWFEKNGVYTKNSPSVTPKPGDVYITAGEKHTGIVEKVEGGKVYAISGNTSIENNSNGVGVGDRTYTMGDSEILGFGSLK